MATVSELLKDSLAKFGSLISSNSLGAYEKEVPLQKWGDELGRLRVWAANIGAHQTGQSSLDYRLRDASHIRDQTARLLERLNALLVELTELLEEDLDSETQDEGLEGLEELEDDLDGLDDLNGTPDIQQIHKSLVETITNLYQMSMVIRKPAHHDRLIGTDKLDAEPFRFWTKQHVSHKYPAADELVIDRISTAMAKQRAVLKYRERHHAKMSVGIDPEDGKSNKMSETVVSVMYQHAPAESNDLASEAGASETSYGASLLDGEGKMTIPPMPKEGANQTPFECPYCFFIIKVRDRRAWARHIFRDLMLYVCILPECPTPNKLYESRRQWYHHVRETHSQGPIADGSFTCSICKQDSLPAVTFQRHVGRHLEELALFVLPRTTSDEEEEPVETNDEQGSERNEDSLSETSILDQAMDPDADRSNEKGKAPAVPPEEGKASFQEPALEEETVSTEDSNDDDELHDQHVHPRAYNLPDKRPEGSDTHRDLELLKQQQEIARQQEEEQEKERIKQEIREEDTRMALEAEKRRETEHKMKAAAIEEWKEEQERQKQKQKEKDKEFRQRLQDEFEYTEEEIEAIIGKKKTEAKDENPKDNLRVTWIKIHRKHLLPETVDAYSLPWVWDEFDSSYIIIKQWIDEDFQEELFAHTRRLRESQNTGETGEKASSSGQDKVNKSSKRKKNSSRKSWLFT